MEYLSTDPNAGLEGYLSTDPNAGLDDPNPPEQKKKKHGWIDSVKEFAGNIQDQFTSGAESALTAARLSGDVASGRMDGNAAKLISGNLRLQQQPKPAALTDVEKSFDGPAKEYEAAGNWSDNPIAKLGSIGKIIWTVGEQAVTNPEGVAYLTASQIANMAPSIAGMVLGAKGGAALGAVAAPVTGGASVPIGAIVGGVSGAFAGEWPMEVGSEFVGAVGKELQARGLPGTEQNISALLADKTFMNRALSQVRTKATTTSAIDSAFTLGAGRIATGPARKAMSVARAELGASADAVKVSERAKEILKTRTVAQRVGTGAKAVGADVAGGGLSESGGQYAGYGKVNLADVGMEMLGELGGAGIEVPAAAWSAGKGTLDGPRTANVDGNDAIPADTILGGAPGPAAIGSEGGDLAGQAQAGTGQSGTSAGASGPSSSKPTEAEQALMRIKPITALDRVAEIDAEESRLKSRLQDLNDPANGYGPMFDAERQEIASLRLAMALERDGITRTWPAAQAGAETNFSTEAGARIQARYALMDVDDLTTSHDENLRPTPAYPPELQPRERERAASEMQISSIVQKLDPARLGESADAANGAPIVGADGLVESGNARTIALKRVYRANGAKAAGYRQFIKDNAARFGLTPEQVDGMRRPVLVRVRTTPVNRAEFALQANAATVAQMSPSEQARADAARIDNLDGLNPDENGEFVTGSSRDFVRSFMARLPGTEQSGMIDANGALSQTGYTRMRNAVLAKAYGDSPVLMRMVESLDDNTRNLTRALMQAAPKVAKTRAAVQEGALFDADFAPDLMAAVEELSRLKDAGRSLHDALAQAGMFGEQYTPETRELMQFLADNIRRPRRIAEFITNYYDALTAAGNPAQGSVFGDTAAPSKSDLMAAARGATNGEPAAVGGQSSTIGNGSSDQQLIDKLNSLNPQLNGRLSVEWVEPGDPRTANVNDGNAASFVGGHNGSSIILVKGKANRRTLLHEIRHMIDMLLGGYQLRKWLVEDSALMKRMVAYLRDERKAGRIDKDSRMTDAEETAQSVLDAYYQDKERLREEFPDVVEYLEKMGADKYESLMQEVGADDTAEQASSNTTPARRSSDATATARSPDAGRAEPAQEDRGQPQDAPRDQAGDGGDEAARRAAVDRQWGEALADLGAIVRDHAGVARMLPEDTPNLMPTLVKLFEVGIEKVGYNIKDLMAHVKAALKAMPEFKAVWNKIDNAIYRKAAMQAIANAEAAPGNDLFSQPAGDLFSQPANNVGAGESAKPREMTVIDGLEYDLDAPNFGLASWPKTLADNDPLLTPTDAISTPAREAMRDQWVDRHFADAEPVIGRKPIAFVMGGGGASGKGTIKKYLRKQGEIQAAEAVDIDPDELKFDIPEFDKIKESGDSRGAAVVHEESSMLAKRIKARAMAGRYDMILDVTLGNQKKGTQYLLELKDAGYEVRLYGVTVDPATAVIRALKRAEHSRRFVPIGELLKAHKGFLSAFEQYVDLVDAARLYENTTGIKNIAEKVAGKLEVKDRQAYNGIAERRALNERANTLREIGGTQQGVGRSPDENGEGRTQSEGTRQDGPSGGRSDGGQGRGQEGNSQEGGLNDDAHTGRGQDEVRGPGAVPATGRGGSVEGVLGRDGGRGDQRDGQPADADRQEAGVRAGGLLEAGGDTQQRTAGGKGNRPERTGVSEGRLSPDEKIREGLEELGAVLRRIYAKMGGVRMLNEEERAQVMPALVKIFEGLIEKGVTKAKALIAQAQAAMKRHDNESVRKHWNKVLPEHYAEAAQQALNNVEGRDTQGDLFAAPSPSKTQATGDLFANPPKATPRKPEASRPQASNPPEDIKPPKPTKDKPVPAGRDIPPKTGRNYRFGDDDLTYQGSWIKKAEQNVEAVELVKRLQQEGRQATREEQTVLARFIGWGATDLANNLFGGKLDKQLELLRKYDIAVQAMKEAGRDYLAPSGYQTVGYSRRYVSGDPDFHEAFAVLQAKNPDLRWTEGIRITREELDKARPSGNVKKWAELRDRLRAVMTDEELKAGEDSTINAHYTSKPIVKSMWRAMERMGFHGGAILEPGAGIGVFPGLMPAAMATNSAYTGIELDTITGEILKQLFPDERIAVESFIESALPDAFYDVAAGNPPFANFPVLADPRYRKLAMSLHDYFFAKTMDKVKPGGLVMFVTSRYTMDKIDDKARKFLAERADLVGAIRLPQTAFKQNAGTDVVTDVLFLRKKVEGETFEQAQDWGKVAPVTINGKPYNINQYFHDHPEMVLGSHSDKGKMANSPDPQYTVEPIEGDIDALFDKAVDNLPADIYRATGEAATAAKVREIDFNPKVKKEGNFYVTDAGVLMQVEGGVGVRAESVKPKDVDLVKAYVPLRNAVKQAQYDQLNDGPWEQSMAAMQKAYQAFVKKHGNLLQYKTRRLTTKDTVFNEETGQEEEVTDEVTKYTYPVQNLLADDPDSNLVMALENVNEETGVITTTPALTERVLMKPASPRIETPHDALLSVLNDTGQVDIALIAERIGLDAKDAIAALGTAIYETPGGQWQMADEYLSGNVKRKLDEARKAAESDRRFERNVQALTEAQPSPVTQSDINVQLGQRWIDPSVVQRFMAEIAGINTQVFYNDKLGGWTVDRGNAGKKKNAETGRMDWATTAKERDAAMIDWGTSSAPAHVILEHALNASPVRIETWDAAAKKKVFNKVETDAAIEKVKKMREAFKSWVWTDEKRADELVRTYNDRFNVMVARKFDGRHLTMPGSSSLISVFDHVKRGAWRIVQDGNTYLAHAVGSGKTWQMVISAMEQKRLGLINKPMIVVPNHMLQQFKQEWLQLYPAARLMVADEKQFHTDNRRRFVARAALSDLDGVIITHSAFKLLDLDPEFKRDMIEQELEYLRAALEEQGVDLDEKSRDPKVKEIVNRIKSYEQKLEKLTSGEGKDKSVRFDEMGVDFLYVDEAHEFRKLAFTTTRQVKGISASGSERAFDLWIKTRWLEQKKPGRNLVMASGTPVTNTLAELYSVQKFMDYATLEDQGLERFDDWAAQYGEEDTQIEADAAGVYAPVTRFAKFNNVPELTQAFRQFADVLTSDHLAEMLGDKRPRVQDGSRKLVVTPRTEQYQEFNEQVLKPRLNASRNWKPSPDEQNNPDPIIRIIGDGRLAAIDMRFMDPALPNDPDSKLNQMIDGVIRVYKESADLEYRDKKGNVEPNKGAAQMVFSDLGFGEGVANRRGFNARAWFEKRLRDAGIPMNQVAFMSDYKKSVEKVNLFRDVNAGKVRVLVGSSKNMGTGVNAQQRLIALHHMDTPWYPADLEQREGRIIRQGNKNPLVQVYAYSTKGSYDQVMWQMLARKQKFIEQAMSGDSSVRSLEDVSESSQYAMAVAMTAGDPDAINLAGARADIEKYLRLQRHHEENRVRMRTAYNQARNVIDINTKLLPEAEKRAAKVQDLSGDKFKAQVMGQNHEARKDWSQALLDVLKNFAAHGAVGTQTVGGISGFDVQYIGKAYKNQQGIVDRFETTLVMPLGDTSVVLALDADEDLIGMSMRATNALVALKRKPDEMRQAIADAQSRMVSLEARMAAPFEHAQALADKIKEAAEIEARLVANSAQRETPEQGGETKLSRGHGQGQGMAMRDLEAVVARIRQAMGNLPTVHVLSSPTALDLNNPAQARLREFIEDAGAMDDVEGATHEGEIYMFASGLADDMRAEHVLATHEVTHYGLRGVFGNELDVVLNEIWAGNANIRKQASALRERTGLRSNVAAVEEVLADMDSADLVKLIGWRRLVQQVRDWFRAHGFTRLANKIDKLLKAGLTGRQQADLLVAEVVGAARDWVKGGKRTGKVVSGTALADVRKLADDLPAQEKWLNTEARARGYRDIDDLAGKDYLLFEKLAQLWRKKHPADVMLSRSAIGLGWVVTGYEENPDGATAGRATDAPTDTVASLTRDGTVAGFDSSITRLSRAIQPDVAERADAILADSTAKWRPVEAVVKAGVKVVRFDRATKAVYAKAGKLLDALTPEKVKAGVVADYGIPGAVLDQRAMMQGRKRVQLRKTEQLIEKLATLTRAESRVAYEWLNNDDPQAAEWFEQQLPAESVQVLKDVREMIDKLSQEAVRLGQLDPETYQRHRYAYLRRSYAKYMEEMPGRDKAKRQRAIAILGDQYKGRGITDAIEMKSVQNIAPEWWRRKLQSGKADKGMKDAKLVRLERRAPSGEGTTPIPGIGDRSPGRLLEVVYWPSGEPMPVKYKDWEQNGTWKVIDTKGAKLILWRDFTKQERVAMGEIDEARFAIARTLHGMVNDIETGRYLAWLADRFGEVDPARVTGPVVEASERMRDTFAPDEWVRVPETVVPGTRVARYGKLAGSYLPGPIWNDVRQVVGGRFQPLGETYAAILSAWKTSKTALSPAVHMNNVMANMVMADWHDVGAGHMLKALRIILAAGDRDGKGVLGRIGNAASRAGISDREAAREILNRFQDSGGGIGTWITQEIQQEQLLPLIDALESELQLTGQTQATQIGVMAALQHMLRLRFGYAWQAFKGSKPGKPIVQEARNLIQLYESEDQVFRLAAWLKAKEEGINDLEAGKLARRSFLDYHINAPWVQMMRQTAFPFIAFTYRSVPMLLDTVANKPWKLLKLAMLGGALNAIGYALSGGDEDDERKLLPDEKAGRIWGMVPKLIRMPWNDQHASPVFLDVRRFVPVGDIFDVGQTNAAIPILPALVPSGPLVLIGEIALNKSAFTGRAITMETDTTGEMTGKVFDHLYKSLAPNIAFLPGTYAWTNVTNAGSGKTDAFGRELSVAQALSSSVGIKLGSYPRDVLMLNARSKADAEVMEIQRNIANLKREFARGGMDRAEFSEKIEAQVQKKISIKEALQEKAR